MSLVLNNQVYSRPIKSSKPVLRYDHDFQEEEEHETTTEIESIDRNEEYEKTAETEPKEPKTDEPFTYEPLIGRFLYIDDTEEDNENLESRHRHLNQAKAKKLPINEFNPKEEYSYILPFNNNESNLEYQNELIAREDDFK